MAKINGSVSQRSDSYSFYINWSESDVSTANNTSKITATAYIYCSAHTAWASGLSQSLTIDGTKFTATKTVNLSSGVTVALVSGSKIITHNADGKKSVAISASCDLPDGGGWGPAWGSASGTATLTTIPRTSKVSLSNTNFSIGSSVTINTNRASSSFTHTAVIKFNGSTVRTQTGIGASYTWNTSELYQYIPKANKATGTVTLTTYSGSTKIGESSVSFTANVTNSNPTFSNCTYADVGNTSTELTGNNQVLINGYNTLKVTISTANKAIAKNSATMVKYRLVCGSKSTEVSYSSNANVTLSLNNVTNMTFIVYAIDSRGNSTAVTKSVAEWKDYSAITIKAGSAIRTDGVGKETTLTFEGTFWKSEELYDFGAVSNEVILCQYKYKKSNESEYGQAIDIIPNISENKFSFSSSIQGDAGAEGFNLSNSFNIQITVKDKIKTATYDILLGAGSPAIAIGAKGIAIGAPYDETQGGLLQFLLNQYGPINGAINLKNSDIINANCIWMNDESTGKEGINFLKQRWRQNKFR